VVEVSHLSHVTMLWIALRYNFHNSMNHGCIRFMMSYNAMDYNSIIFIMGHNAMNHGCIIFMMSYNAMDNNSIRFIMGHNAMDHSRIGFIMGHNTMDCSCIQLACVTMLWITIILDFSLVIILWIRVVLDSSCHNGMDISPIEFVMFHNVCIGFVMSHNTIYNDCIIFIMIVLDSSHVIMVWSR